MDGTGFTAQVCCVVVDSSAGLETLLSRSQRYRLLLG